MNGSQVVRAKITLLPKEINPRSNPLKTKFYRPNHNFHGDNPPYMFMGQVNFKDDSVLDFGESREAEVCFLATEELKPFLKVGQKWRIHEASHFVAVGEILEVSE